MKQHLRVLVTQSSVRQRFANFLRHISRLVTFQETMMEILYSRLRPLL